MKKLKFLWLLFLPILLLTGCDLNTEYYSIEQTEVSEEELFIFKNENLILTSDKMDFYINNNLTIKQLLEFDKIDEEYKVALIEEINLNAAFFGTDLSNYSFKNLKTGESILFRKLVKGNPCLIIKLSAFCDACDSFNFDWLETVEKSKYNYVLLADNIDEEEQYKYIVEKGGNPDNIYISDGSLDGTDILTPLNTPNLIFVSNDNKIRIISEFFALDGEAMVSYLNLIDQDY